MAGGVSGCGNWLLLSLCICVVLDAESDRYTMTSCDGFPYILCLIISRQIHVFF